GATFGASGTAGSVAGGRLASRGATNLFGWGLGSASGRGRSSFADAGATFGASGTAGSVAGVRFASRGATNFFGWGLGSASGGGSFGTAKANRFGAGTSRSSSRGGAGRYTICFDLAVRFGFATMVCWAVVRSVRGGRDIPWRSSGETCGSLSRKLYQTSFFSF